MIFSLLFKKLAGHSSAPASKPAVLNWAKTGAGKYPRLITVNENHPSLKEQSGVFVIWSKWGPKITWLHVGASSDLSKMIKAAKDDHDILAYNEKGSVGVTWAFSNPKYRHRIAAYLKLILRPTLVKPDLNDDTNFADDPFPVYPPPL